MAVGDSLSMGDTLAVGDTFADEAAVRPAVIGVYEFLTTTYASHPAAVQARATLKELAARRDARKAFADSVANALAIEAAAKLARADSLARLNQASSADSISTSGLVVAVDSLLGADSPATDDSGILDSAAVAAQRSPSGLASDSNVLPNGRSDSSVVVRPGFPVPTATDSDEAAAVPVKGVVADSVGTRVPDTRPAPTIIDVAEADEAPVLVGGDAELFRRMGLEQFDETVSGTISVSFVVGADGKVAQVTVEKGLSEIVDREITRALYQSRFQPGLKDGRIVAVRVKRDFDIAVD